MKIKANKVIQLITIFIILVEYDYFKLIGLGGLTRSSIIFPLIFGIGIFCRFERLFVRKIKGNLHQADHIVITIIVCSFGISLYTLIVYDSNPIDIYSVIVRLFTIVFIYSLMFFFESEKKEEYILHNILTLGIIMYMIKFLIWYLFNFHGIVIAPQIIFEYGKEWTRNNIFRLDDSSLMYLFLFSCLFYYRKNKKIRYLIYAGIQLFYSIIVTASRSSTVSLAIIILIDYIISSPHALTKLRKYLILFIGGLVILGTTTFQNFINSFKLSGHSSSLSSVTRLNALSYYIDTLNNMENPLKYIFGLGALSTNVVREKAILRGPLGIYFIEDLGILGIIFQYGLIGLYIVLTIYVTQYKCAKKKLHITKDYISYQNSIILIMCMLIPSLLAQCIFDKSRIVALPFFISLVLYYSKIKY